MYNIALHSVLQTLKMLYSVQLVCDRSLKQSIWNSYEVRSEQGNPAAVGGVPIEAGQFGRGWLDPNAGGPSIQPGGAPVEALIASAGSSLICAISDFGTFPSILSINSWQALRPISSIGVSTVVSGGSKICPK